MVPDSKVPEDVPGSFLSPGEMFSRLLVRNQQRILGFIFSLVHDRQAASEILQDVSMVLWRKFDRYEPGTDFAAWAMSVARLSIFEWRRRQSKLPLPLDDEELERLSDEAVSVGFDFEERLKALQECLKRLAVSDRELLNERYSANEAMSRIAERICISRVALYKRLNRIHVSLLACIRRKMSERAV